jgi:hypothetical protein
MPAFAGMTHLQGYDVGTVISATAKIYGLNFAPFVKDLDTHLGYDAPSRYDVVMMRQISQYDVFYTAISISTNGKRDKLIRAPDAGAQQ